jgi:sentrin-specific protease 1
LEASASRLVVPQFWLRAEHQKTPQQDNGSDCGVFSVQTLDALARGKDLTKPEEWEFGATNMPYIRDLMIYEIGQQKLEPRWPKEQ